jgi:hypothetical protein
VNLDSGARRVLTEKIARARRISRITGDPHAKQNSFALDRSPRQAALSGRRSGKSHGLAKKYLITAIENPNETSVFVGVSAARANDILSRGFRVLANKLNLEADGLAPRATKRSGQLYYEFDNGHKVWVAGCCNRADAEKFRGDPYCLVGVDEADSMRNHLEYLCLDVLEPALLDFGGTLILTGTPGVTPVGYFHDVTTGENGIKQWSTHHWTVLDNPFLPGAARWLQNHIRELGLDESSATYQREWMGSWVTDIDALVYAWDASRDAVCEAPDLRSGDWRVVIGADLGVSDPTALVAGAYQVGVPDLYLLESQSWPGLSPSGAYVRLREWLQRYPGARVVADTGGQGKAFAAEWSDTYGLYVDPAKKLDVAGQVAFCNGLLRSGVLHVHATGCRSLITQWSTLPWNQNRTGHDPAYADHEADAARYCVLAMRPNYKAELEVAQPGTAEAFAAEQAERKARVLSEAIRKRRRAA